MKTDDAKSIVQLVRDASPADVAFVSFAVLPILLTGWTFLLKTVGAFPESIAPRIWIMAILVCLYVVAVIVMKRSQVTRTEKLRAAKHIRNRLERRPAPYTSLASFDYIRRNVNESYTNEFLSRLIDEFPDQFMRQPCTDGGRKPERPGIRLKQEDSE
jgi:hypothetical protein